MLKLFSARRPTGAAPTSFAPSTLAFDARREVLAIAVRETLRRHGIPSYWITTETQSVVTRHGERGLQLRLVLREWEPRLLHYCVALQKAIRARVLRLDPQSIDWFGGATWKFDLIDDSRCPALPAGALWQAPPRGVQAASADDEHAPSANDAEPDFCPTEPMQEPPVSQS